MSDLKPCPFFKVEKDIGHSPYTMKRRSFWNVKCTCGARGPMSPSEDYAIKTWNTRPELIEDIIIVGYEEIREIYAGMDGFISETAPEGYQQRIIKQMYDVAIKNIEPLKSKR